MAKKMKYEEWRALLRASCGHYYSEPAQIRSNVEQFEVDTAFGLDRAWIRCQINDIKRTQYGIKRDDAEHFFLIYQISGEMGVRHCDKDSLLSKGDFLLLDSTQPADLIFDGNTSEFYSLHLPRSLFLAGRLNAPATGTKVTSRHPLHASLSNLFICNEEVNLEAFHSDYLFDFVSMVFGPDPAQLRADSFRYSSGRQRFIQQVIDQNMKDNEFCIDRLAKIVGRSRRQLQRDFLGSGTSFTEVLQQRRLRHVVAAGSRTGRMGRTINMAELAQLSGFYDQSHFNRVFRQHYDAAPRDFFSKCLDPN